MVTSWYYESDGEVCGPISGSEMRRLAAKGEITRSTRVRPADRDTWIASERVKGLFTSSSDTANQSTSAQDERRDAIWYLRDITGRTFGPVTRTRLNEWHHKGQISADCQVRHKDWPEWQSAAKLYSDLRVAKIDWTLLPNRIVNTLRLIRDRERSYFAKLTIDWSPSPPHLRRCLSGFHHQSSPHAPCTCCGGPTVGLQVADVVNGNDSNLRHAYEIWDKEKRRVFRVFARSLVICVLISIVLFFITWWFLVLVPVTLAIGFAVPFLAARHMNRRIELALTERASELPDSISEKDIDDISDAYINPFLRRNEVPLGTVPPADSFVVKRFKSLEQATDVLVSPTELELLGQLLAGKGLTLWMTRSDANNALTSFALKDDYSMFKQRVGQLESNGVSVLAAYASLVNQDDDFLPFLQQLLVERQIPEIASSLIPKLERIRRDFKLKGFAKDLEKRRHGSVSITLEMVDNMDPYNFELLLGMIYETQGHRAIETPKSGDQGADVLLEKAGERTVIQAKLYSDPVGNKAVQEAIAARSHFHCHAAKVVTNNYFTASARDLAQSSDVTLIGRDELAQMIVDFNKSPKDYSRLATLMEPATS